MGNVYPNMGNCDSTISHFLYTGDEAYLSDEEKIKEYVMRQRGLIYRGTAYRPVPLNWYFGQVRHLFAASKVTN